MAALAYTPLRGQYGRKNGSRRDVLAGTGTQPTLRLVAVPSRGGNDDTAVPVAFRPVLVESFRPDPVEPEIVYAPITPLRRDDSGIAHDRVAAEQRQVRRRAHAAKMLRRRLRALGVGGLVIALTCGLWFGTAAMASSAHGQLQVLPGSVQTAHGYLYRIRAGDTVWSIATRLDPSGDPRPIADGLEAELGGTDLQVGAELLVP